MMKHSKHRNELADIKRTTYCESISNHGMSRKAARKNAGTTASFIGAFMQMAAEHNLVVTATKEQNGIITEY